MLYLSKWNEQFLEVRDITCLWNLFDTVSTEYVFVNEQIRDSVCTLEAKPIKQKIILVIFFCHQSAEIKSLIVFFWSVVLYVLICLFYLACLSLLLSQGATMTKTYPKWSNQFLFECLLNIRYNYKHQVVKTMIFLHQCKTKTKP